MRDIARHQQDGDRQSAGAAGEGKDSGANERAAERVTLLIRTAKLITDKGEFLCVLRDASETGVSVRTFHRLPDCESVVLELPNGDRHGLDIVWQEEHRAGLKFHEQADLVRLVENPSRFAKRSLRVKCEVPGQIVCLTGICDVRIHDLSQHGAQIECGQHLAIDQRLTLKGRGLPEVDAKVRWRRDGRFGLAFEDTFQFGDFARTVARLQLGSLPG